MTPFSPIKAAQDGITIVIKPSARPDINQITVPTFMQPDEELVLSGNVLTNDVAAADKRVIAVNDIPLDGQLMLFGQYGVLLLEANGQYDYILDSSILGLYEGRSVADVFSYTMINGSYTAQSTLTIVLDGQGGATASDDILFGFQDENEVLSGFEGNDEIYGRAGDDILNGDAGDDYLDGGEGVDLLRGGQGDDVYARDDQQDVIEELADQGEDTIEATVNTTLPDHVEILVLIDQDDLRGVGNDASNLIYGNQGNNTILAKAGDDSVYGGRGQDTIVAGLGHDFVDGGQDADTLMGGLGDDAYVVDHVGDQVIESSNQGLDLVYSKIDYQLGADVEELILLGQAQQGTGNSLDNLVSGNQFDNTLRGLAGVDILYGRAGQDQLIGGEGGDWLDGGTGADLLIGGAGDDVYIRDHLQDVIEEQAAEGIDGIIASVHTVLGEHVEHLKLTGTQAINGTGNALNNEIVGNHADNTLHGRAGDDQLCGGLGADTLMGGAGHDRLDGGKGADMMYGGLGDDIYLISHKGDQAIEVANQGYDVARSLIHYQLADSIEAGLLLGDQDLRLTGNELNNILIGNRGDNRLEGGLGDDHLEGGLGSDTYVFRRGAGMDTINEDDATLDQQDRLMISGARANQLLFRRVEDTLQIEIVGTHDVILIEDWFFGSDHQIEHIYSGDGKVLNHSDVQLLVDAMAGLPPPVLGDTQLSVSQRFVLKDVFAQAWQVVSA